MRDLTTLQQPRYEDLGALAQGEVTSTSFQFSTDEGSTLVVETYAPGVFRVTVTPQGGQRPDRVAELADLLARHEPVNEGTISAIEGGWRIVQGEDALEIRPSPLRFALYRQERLVLAAGSEAVPAIAHAPASDDESGPDAAEWVLQFSLTSDEGVYGLGENPWSLDRRGECIQSDDPAANALPLAWSPRGWGIHVNTIGRQRHFVDAHPDLPGYVIEVTSRKLDLFLCLGEPADVLYQYSQATGRAGQPPLWAVGVWLRQAPGATPQQMLELATTLRGAGIGVEAVSFDPPAAWEVKGRHAFEWDGERFPDSRNLLAQYKQADVRFVACGFPGVPNDSPAFDELEDRGWLFADDDGNAHQFPGLPATGGKPFGLLDLTHRDVYNFWCERNRQLFDDGVDAIACDAQLDIPDSVTARNGAAGARLRQLYPLLTARNLFEAASWDKVPAEGVVWHRDAFPSAQRIPFRAGPAVPNSWEGLEAALRAALSTGASGVPVQSIELGSQEYPTDEMTPELYLRWLAVGVFSAHFRFQGVPALLPSAFDEATQQRIRTWVQWRYRFIPYVLGAIEDAARNGLPVQRSMALAFPDDPDAHAFESQYLLGPALLVAPLLQSGDEVTVYFPKGEAWWDLSTGWRYEGGTAWTFPCPNGSVPVFGREGHILCLGTGGLHTGEFNSARLLEEVWLFGMPTVSPTVMRNKIRVMQMQGSSYIKGLEGLRILPSEGLEVKRRGAEVRISRAR